jgi:hypothetical protein
MYPNESDSHLVGDLFLILMVAGLAALAAFGAGQRIGERDMQKEAVKRGHAVWKVDDAGASSFNWK